MFNINNNNNNMKPFITTTEPTMKKSKNEEKGYFINNFSSFYQYPVWRKTHYLNLTIAGMDGSFSSWSSYNYERSILISFAVKDQNVYGLSLTYSNDMIIQIFSLSLTQPMLIKNVTLKYKNNKEELKSINKILYSKKYGIVVVNPEDTIFYQVNLQNGELTKIGSINICFKFKTERTLIMPETDNVYNIDLFGKVYQVKDFNSEQSFDYPLFKTFSPKFVVDYKTNNLIVQPGKFGGYDYTIYKFKPSEYFPSTEVKIIPNSDKWGNCDSIEVYSNVLYCFYGHSHKLMLLAHKIDTGEEIFKDLSIDYRFNRQMPVRYVPFIQN